MQHGHAIVAGKLDGCTGTFARDAALPPVIVPVEMRDDRLAVAARGALVGSPASLDAQREWKDANGEGGWWRDATFDTRVLHHPVTGATWVFVHARVGHECGEPGANVLGLYRVDARGALAPVQQRTLDTLDQIDHVVDLYGDGELEMIGKPWLGFDVLVERASGEKIEELALPFFGCPC
jgi:hypothetical protein